MMIKFKSGEVYLTLRVLQYHLNKPTKMPMNTFKATKTLIGI